MKNSTLLINIFLILIKHIWGKVAKIEDLEGLIKIYNKELQKVSDIVKKEKNILLAFGEKQLLNRGDLKFYTQMQKATQDLSNEGYDIKFGFFDSEIRKNDKNSFALHPHSLPKIIFFKNYGKEFKVYKGGKVARLIQAWVKRNLRKIGLNEFYVTKTYQLKKKLFMLYYGEENTKTFKFFKNDYWLKKRKFPVYRLMNFSLLKDIGCNPTNKTEKNFVMVVSKNSTYSPCAVFYYTNLTEIRSVMSQMMKMEEDKNLGVRSFADNLKRLFKQKEKFFLYYDKSIKTAEYQIYSEFCSKTKIECFFEHSNDTRTTNLKKYFLGIEEPSEENYVYLIDTREVYPSFKYRTKDFYDVKSLTDFKNKVLNGKWERFYVSEKEIPENRKKNKNVWITTADTYKKDVKEFKGDVVLMLVNSQNRENDMVYLAKFYEIARLVKRDYGNVPIKFMAVDVTRNDLPEFANMGTPLFFLYDYIDKDPRKIVLHKDVENSVAILKDLAPSFTDPDLEDL